MEVKEDAVASAPCCSTHILPIPQTESFALPASLPSLPFVLTVDTKAAPDAQQPAQLSSSNFCLQCGRLTHIDDDDDNDPVPPGEVPQRKKFKKDEPIVSKKQQRTSPLKWIQCDGCNKWLHLKCAGLEEFESDIFDQFHCTKCAAVNGPSILHRKLAPHRYRYYAPDEVDLPTEMGTEVWCEKFKRVESTLFSPPTEDEVTIYKNGAEFSNDFSRDTEWRKIFLIKNKGGLDMNMPEPGAFTVESIVEIMGENYEVDTIDVYRQETYSMKLGSFLKKIRDSAPREKLYNFLSLEFSDSDQMGELVSPPYFVSEISFVHRLWPDRNSPAVRTGQMHDVNSFRVLDEHLPMKPKVAEFCLVGMGGSYTDFHIDFGGSSVWYHIYKGRKIFYVAAPTKENLKAYEMFQSEKSTTAWFGDSLPPGTIKRVVIDEGETLMIPAGWIHAVYTPVDSIVFGGNYLHSYNIEMQLKIYELENRIRSRVSTDEKFFFPSFELVNWYAVSNFLVEPLREYNDEGSAVDQLTWKSAQCFLPVLQKWIERDRAKSEARGGEKVGYTEIFTKFLKEFRRQEKIRVETLSPKKKYKKRRSDGTEGGLSPTKTPKAAEIYYEATPKEEEKSPISMGMITLPKISLRLPRPPSPDKHSATQMFSNSRSRSGRKIQVSAAMKLATGDSIVQTDVKEEERNDSMPRKKPRKLFRKKRGRPPKPPTDKPKNAPPPPKKTKAVTAKQRLAKCLKLK
ncbi:unnamed protein product [Caenorhabditis auriculariae]|uniref:JmjC domain-containing protein n=1 Tax=Caenorhabditis auriculariae TaxID=2777116 RepID=A0A8S1HNM1_9PELO|nr:unnamed protein product [Caenorhabditis auriculariae]